MAAGRVRADNAAAHGRAAPLEAPRSVAGRLGAKVLGEVDAAAEDDAVPTADRQEPRLDTGASVGLHGSDPGARVAAWLEAGGVLRDDVARGVEVVARAGFGADTGQPATETLTASPPLLAKVSEPIDEVAEDVLPPSPPPTPPTPHCRGPA
ncbi:unnamed protein product [Closterium sp. NIES-53]